jgi:eukaryotic-like serine/threonine-protein kinase
VLDFGLAKAWAGESSSANVALSPSMSPTVALSHIGTTRVYVEPFRRAGRRVRVSPDGGGQPKWRRDGRELYYVNANGKLMAVSVQPGEELTVGLPQPLFDIKPFQADQDDYAVSADGQLFLVKVPVDSAEGGRLQVVVNSPALQSR